MKSQTMWKKISISFIIIMFVLSSIIFIPKDDVYEIVDVKTPLNFILNNKEYQFQNYECFDPYYSEHNKVLAKKNNISEKEAFIIGNLGKNWAKKFMLGREILIYNQNDFIFDKYSYISKFLYSGFCFQNGNPYHAKAFNRRIDEARKTKYKVLDLDNYTVYNIDDEKIKNLENYILVRNSHIPKELKKKYKTKLINSYNISNLSKNDIVKIFITDFTIKHKPDNNCSSNICQEILSNINNAQHTIDMAIYGYSRVPAIELALKNALQRGVKIRLIYDLNDNNENIYPDTKLISELLKDYQTDKNSLEAKNIMHNKFYIFDNSIVITGSANLSHTDMSGFNSNNIVLFYSKDIASIYKKEFEQMYNGKFHNDKISHINKEFNLKNDKFKVYFSPQDKIIETAILPLINNSKKYIYIPTFILTEPRIANSLIEAKKKGVEIKIIIDALSASNKYSKHHLLREHGILVKTENYAGKMHSKSMIIDDEYTIIGSMNFSKSGNSKNDENLVVIKDEEICKTYKNIFLSQWEKIDNKWLRFNAKAEGKDSIGSCSDGIDNDYDDLIDMQEPTCH